MTNMSIPTRTCLFSLLLISITVSNLRAQESRQENVGYWGNWALQMPDGAAGWLTLSVVDGELHGELWTVAQGKELSDIEILDEQLVFLRNVRIGESELDGGPPTGESVACRHRLTINGDAALIVMEQPQAAGEVVEVVITGRRLPPLPPPPDLSKVQLGEPIELFNGRNLEGWRLTNPRQINGWEVIDGILVNTTPKLDFAPYSRYGNLRTEQEFTDFNLQIDFRVPADGNSGIYLRGMYEAQVVDRDSRMQGIQGVGAIFGRIEPTENAGKTGDEWQHYDITLVDRHATVILNGVKVIDNQPIAGCTNGALHADETLPGPIYLQGDHTAVSYRNIVLRPVIKDDQQRDAEVIAIFNGNDLTGWHADVPEADENPEIEPSFVVRDGLLVSQGTPRGHLITDAEFANYRLVVEYRFPGEPGNCGILVHSSTPRVLYEMFPASIEVQMNSGHAGDFWCIGENIEVPDMEARRPRNEGQRWGGQQGDARRIFNLTDDSENPVGEWNTMVIECVENEVHVHVNGDLVNYGFNCSVAEGQIAIQAEEAEVEFRKLELTRLQ